MNNSIINATVSMNALQQRLDLLAENMANVNTAGYKRKEATFQDLLTNAKQQPEPFRKDGRVSPLGYNQGWGTRFIQQGPDMTQGSLKQTGTSTDLALDGNALFVVDSDGNGGRGYTRSGAFQLTVNGQGDTILATDTGYPVLGQVPVQTPNGVVLREGSIVVPQGVSLQISNEGVIEGIRADGTRTQLGTLTLVQPTRPDALVAVADNLFAVPADVDAADILAPVVAGVESGVAVRQGYIEQSNVDLVEEMTELLSVQRAYQLSARALSSADNMAGLANNMRA
ncbi:flagellar hook-basal body protein [Paenibacillus herberti]|uniref:Flagellar hook-basal body protein n=1 Tax=Paenibacillus herberti TaxID=1619309 RepID=A0A229NWH6_9BACL|nr:flagellar hook-basal body protein [Paenibacillus herberti]OXM14154.1 flagellar hook-basal body protein [Paenibacillus herberti]